VEQHDHATAATNLQKLSTQESMTLLRDKSYVGRVAFVVDGEPFILPVNYLAEGDSVVFSTGKGTKLALLGAGAQVAFEVDNSRPFDHAGWSVVVHGTARDVTDPDEVERLRRGPLKSWAKQASQHWVRISIAEITGRRLTRG